MDDLGLHLADEGPQEGGGEGRLEVGVEARVPLEGVEGAGDVVAEQDAAAQDVLQDGTCGIQCSVLTHVGSLPLRATVSVLSGVLAMNPEPNKFYSCMLHSRDRKSTRLNSSHVAISYAVFCLQKKTHYDQHFV